MYMMGPSEVGVFLAVVCELLTEGSVFWTLFYQNS